MAHNIYLGLAALVFVVSFVKLLESFYAAVKVPGLPETRPTSSMRLPRLSAVVPARNEEAGLKNALCSLLDQDYPEVEVIAVDDRSTDATGRILDRLSEARENLRVVHVGRLPEGWIGKNHAVYLGAEEASGDWLLFTDADVNFHPGALRRAVAYAEERGLDHLTLVPRWELNGYWLRGIVSFFYVVFLLYQGAHRANIPSYKTGVGIGAFNLIRKSAYQEVGTYEAFAERPDDDLCLGRRVKELGLRQKMLLGHRLISVEWYSSPKALAQGFEKNLYATLDYSLVKTLLYSASLVLVTVWPFVAVFFSEAYVLLLYLGAILSQLGTYAVTNRFLGVRVLLLAAGYPVFALIFAGVLVRSTLLTLFRGGIYWRDTFYPTSLLRRKKTRARHRSFS